MPSRYDQTVPFKPKEHGPRYDYAVERVVSLFDQRNTADSEIPEAIADALAEGATTTELGVLVMLSAETIRKLGHKADS